jgi:hypothetical protein
VINYLLYPYLFYSYAVAEMESPDQSAGRRMWIPVNIILSFLISIEYFYLLHLENKFYKTVQEEVKKSDHKEFKEEGVADDENNNYATSKSVTNLIVKKDDDDEKNEIENEMVVVKHEEAVKRLNKEGVSDIIRKGTMAYIEDNSKDTKSTMHEVKMGKIEPLGSFH